jgi:deoxyribose-phosphate aldolase
MKPEELAKYIDQTVLKPETSETDILKLCSEAREYRFASVCVNPFWVPLCASELEHSETKVCTVIGFPLGANTSSVKAFETREAVSAGADEVDMVMNIGAAKEGRWETVEADIRAVVEAAGGKTVKVILETCLLNREEIIAACEAAEKAGADFVKTSTGFNKGGATLEDVRLMRETVGKKMGVKASGGVRTAEDALKMIEAGANRIGASAGVAIVTGIADSGSGY